VREEIPYVDRTYLAVPYEERNEAKKAIGALWDPVNKAWYVGPGVDPEKMAKWKIRDQQAVTLDPRAEFAKHWRDRRRRTSNHGRERASAGNGGR